MIEDLFLRAYAEGLARWLISMTFCGFLMIVGAWIYQIGFRSGQKARSGKPEITPFHGDMGGHFE
jgi:hypothetical protein